MLKLIAKLSKFFAVLLIMLSYRIILIIEYWLIIFSSIKLFSEQYLPEFFNISMKLSFSCNIVIFL